MKNFLHLLSFFFFFLIISIPAVFSEGTKQFRPQESHKGELCIDTTRNKFAWYTATDDYRLHIHISDYTTEAIYFGFGEMKHNTGTTTFSLYRPDGSLDTSGTVPTVSGNRGYIDDWSHAVAGPSVVAGTSGYWALRCTPDMNGDYYISFMERPWLTGFGQEYYKTFANFDVTVVKTTNWTALDGRLWSKAWQLYAENPLYMSSNQYWGSMFIYSADSIVTKVDLNGMIPGTFTVSCNQSGCYPVGPLHPPDDARKSVGGEHTYPQYKIFLNNPDINAYGSGTLGGLDNNVPITTQRNCDGTVDFTFGTTKPGNVEIHLLLGALGPPFVDRTLPAQVVSGLNTIQWDGLDGAGNPVPNASLFDFYISYVNGLTHLPLYDVEFNQNGFKLTLVRPLTVPLPPDPLFYWDDSNFGGGTTNFTGCLSSPTSGCHIWNTPGGGFGNNRTINTWWYAVSTSSASTSIYEKRSPGPLGPITGQSNLCPGTNTVNYNVSPGTNATSYQWSYSGTGATIVNNGSTNVTVNFSVFATSGTLSVMGYNDSCGLSGTPSNLLITMLPFPPVVLNPFSPVCIDISPFPLTGGSPAGGTYYINGIASVIFDPALLGTGTHTISYFYSDPVTSCSKTVDQSIVVNPLPVVSLAALNPLCLDAPPFTLSGGSPAGGTFSGTGVTSGMFNPALAGAGTWNITYTFTDGNSCTSSDTKPLTVFALPGVTLAPLADVCINVAPFMLTGGNPSGGTYSGTGVTAGVFDPAAAGAGTHNIVYSFTDNNGCTSSDTKQITVNPLPGNAGIITGPATLCQAASGSVYTTGTITNAVTYSWMLTPVSAGSLTGTGSSVTINWLAGFTGPVTLSVRGVNLCGQGIISPDYNITINPKPVVGFAFCIDSITTTNARPFQLKGVIPSGGGFSGPGVNASGLFTPALAGAGIKSINYTYINSYTCSSSVTKNITVIAPSLFTCGSTFTDPRDNKIYNTVSIGSQCWMVDNLNFGSEISYFTNQRDNCIPEKYCYGNNPANCITSGGLYQWDEIMNYGGAASDQGLCPPGWHLPSENEWTLLFSNYINNGFAGNDLKSTGFSGFNAYLTGVSHANSVIKYSGFATLFWSSQSHGSYKAWAHGMNFYNPSVSSYPSNRNHSFSVRCLKD